MELENYTPELTFDASISTLVRISTYLLQCDVAQEQGNIMKWFNALLVIYKEAESMMTSDECRANKDWRVKAELAVKHYVDYVDKYNQISDSTKRYTKFVPPREAFDVLFEWEVALRRVRDVQKLLMRRRESAGKAWN